MHYFSCSGGTSTNSIKITPGQVTPNLCFAFGGICGSHIAFRCVRGAKRRCTIFHAQVGPIRIPQNVHRDKLRRTYVFLVGYVGHVMHSDASVALNIATLVGTLNTGYPRMQALSQDEGRDGRSCAPTCPVALAPASQLRAAPEPPCAPWHQLPPLGSGQLRCRHVSDGSSSRLLAQGSAGAAMCPMAPTPASQLRAAPGPPCLP
jgi:hypothetical protein